MDSVRGQQVTAAGIGHVVHQTVDLVQAPVQPCQLFLLGLIGIAHQRVRGDHQIA